MSPDLHHGFDVAFAKLHWPLVMANLANLGQSNNSCTPSNTHLQIKAKLLNCDTGPRQITKAKIASLV